MHTPDKWAIVKITGTDPHYRVFASWYGGYGGTDSWRMNSGVISVTEKNDFYIFKGHSGSEYMCHKECYGFNSYGHGVAVGYEKNSGGKLEIIYEMPDIMEMEWS